MHTPLAYVLPIMAINTHQNLIVNEPLKAQCWIIMTLLCLDRMIALEESVIMELLCIQHGCKFYPFAIHTRCSCVWAMVHLLTGNHLLLPFSFHTVFGLSPLCMNMVRNV